MKTRRTEYLKPLKQGAGIESALAAELRSQTNIERGRAHVSRNNPLLVIRRSIPTAVTPAPTPVGGVAFDSGAFDTGAFE